MQRSSMTMLALAGMLGASSAMAAAPAFRTNVCPVRVNGLRLGTDATAGNSSLRNTFAYEPATRLWHFWGFLADDQNFPSAASSLRAVVHATAADALHFTSDSNLSYAFGSADYHAFGAALDPPLDFFRAQYDPDSGTWKLFNWTENGQAGNPSFGQYNYNSSVNDLGTMASTTAVQHQGPLNSPFAGNHVGMFGLVDGIVYLRVDTPSGGAGQFAYTDGIPASTGSEVAEIDLFNGTPYCWFLVSGCGSSDPRMPAYVHNVGRTLRQTDGTIATYYTFRDAGTAARLDKQVWLVESGDNGATWSAPAGVFADGSAITINGQPLDAAPGSANFSSVEMVQNTNICRMYFSTQDANGKYLMVSASTGSACDALFADGFEGCGE